MACACATSFARCAVCSCSLLLPTVPSAARSLLLLHQPSVIGPEASVLLAAGATVLCTSPRRRSLC